MPAMAQIDLQTRVHAMLTELSDRLLKAFSDAFMAHAMGAERAAAAPAKSGGDRAAAKKRATKAAPAAAATKAAKVKPGAKKGGGSAADGRRLPAETRAIADRFAAYVAANPGQKIRQIGPALGMSTADLALPVIRALELGLVRKEGERSSTVYLPPGAAAAQSSGAKKASSGKK